MIGGGGYSVATPASVGHSKVDFIEYTQIFEVIGIKL